jgi:hypothetical protein
MQGPHAFEHRKEQVRKGEKKRLAEQSEADEVAEVFFALALCPCKRRCPSRSSKQFGVEVFLLEDVWMELVKLSPLLANLVQDRSLQPGEEGRMPQGSFHNLGARSRGTVCCERVPAADERPGIGGGPGASVSQ